MDVFDKCTVDSMIRDFKKMRPPPSIAKQRGEITDVFRYVPNDRRAAVDVYLDQLGF